MGAIKQWQIEKLGLMESLYQAFAQLVSDPDQHMQTGVVLQWTTDEGHRSSWQEENGTFVFERQWAQGGVTRLEVSLDSYGEEEEEVGMAEPTHMATVAPSGLVHVYPQDHPETYRVAQAFLAMLAREAQEFFPRCRVCEERAIAGAEAEDGWNYRETV